MDNIPIALCTELNFSFFWKFWLIVKSFENPKGLKWTKLRTRYVNIWNTNYDWYYNDIHIKVTLRIQLIGEKELVPFSTLYTLFLWTWMENSLPSIEKIVYFLLNVDALFFPKRVWPFWVMKTKLLMLFSHQKNFGTFMYPLYPLFRAIKTKNWQIFHIFQ